MTAGCVCRTKLTNSAAEHRVWSGVAERGGAWQSVAWNTRARGGVLASAGLAQYRSAWMLCDFKVILRSSPAVCALGRTSIAGFGDLTLLTATGEVVPRLDGG